ncbi:MAG TPA: hypothetical protein PLI09_26350 [Candidatus Hydrogenedentes bacterium]|nr:hypothetical protein [Candidatus Hydrogenedentota bacterium]
MLLLKHAWNSLVHNARPCVLYVLFNVLAAFTYHAVDHAVSGLIPKNQIPSWAVGYSIAVDILLAALSSVFQAVFFSQLGREIDKPLWKCRNDRDALRRFFLPWFILNLVFITMFRLQARFAQPASNETFFVFEFGILLMYLLAVPVGACIMYWGRLDWAEFPESLSPMSRQFHLLINVLGLNFLQWILHAAVGFALYDNTLGWWLAPTLAIINAPFALMECLAFAAMWQICMIHRTSSYEQDYSDLGF